MLRRMMCLFVAAWSFVPAAFGQGVPNLTPHAQFTHNIRIPAGTASFSNAFWVAKSTSMHLSVLLPTNDYALKLLTPAGTLLAWDPASTTVQSILVPVQGSTQAQPCAYMYHFFLTSPMDGSWTIQASSPTLNPSDWNTFLSADFISSLNAAMAGTATDVVMGNPIALSFAVNDQGAARTDITYSGNLYLDMDPRSAPQAVTFRPVLDVATGAATFVAQVSPSTPGDYTAVAVITGANGAGSFERHASFRFTIRPATAKLTDTITQRIDLSYPAPAP